MTTKTAVEVPADPRWRHVIAVTVLAAVQAAIAARAHRDLGQSQLGQMGDVSLLLDQALDEIDGLAGVTRLVVLVGSERDETSVTVVGEGEEIERPIWQNHGTAATFVDPLTGSFFEWNPTAIRCSFKISAGPPG